MLRRGLAVLILTFPLLAAAGDAGAQAACSRVVVFTLPGITWHNVVRHSPPTLLELTKSASIGSMSVRTNSSRTSLASGYTTIGAGTRMDGGRRTGGGVPLDTTSLSGEVPQWDRVSVIGLDEIEKLAEVATYDGVAGAMAGALDVPVRAVGNGDLGLDPPTPLGHGRWTLLAAMDPEGIVDEAAVGPDLLVEDGSWPYDVRSDPDAMTAAVDHALEECGVTIIDQGDLTRVDEYQAGFHIALPEHRARALQEADSLLAHVMGRLDLERDLLLVVSPNSPGWAPAVHFGVAIAMGPGYEPGTSLVSPSTRRDGIVTLPDVAPTVLDHLGVERPASMLGRSFTTVPSVAGDRLQYALELDDEAVFVDRIRTPVSTIFVVFQVIVYVLIMWLLVTNREHVLATGPRGKALEIATLAVVALPAATYLMGLIEQNALGFVGFTVVLLAVDAALVALSMWVAKVPLDRLLVLSGGTLFLLLIDGLTGAELQLNTVFSYSPIVAGRFAGFGNIAYSVIAATSVLTGTLIVHRWKGSRASLVFVAVLFVVTVIVDGGPAWGSDVGGIIALVPGLGITWLLLSGKRPSWKLVLISLVAMLVALAVFVAIDLARPEESRTHLGRLYEDVSARGFEAFTDTVVRKARTNLRVFTNTIWTYLVPIALLVIGWLFLRPGGRWEGLAITHPRLRAGLISALILSVIGFLVNDSGIVIPALMLSFIVPFALFIHLSIERAGVHGGEDA